VSKLRDLTVPELELYRSQCNFTPEEKEYFELRASDLSNVQISTRMNLSTSKVSKLAKRVSDKISKVKTM
jgi:DNA-binding CsgD family transcriptional regulator